MARILDDGSSSPVLEPSDDSPFSYKQTIVNLFTGEGGQAKPAFSTMSRLKIFLLASFVGLHVLNLCTTLSPKAVISRQSAASSVYGSKVDISSPSIQDALSQLASAHGIASDLIAHVAAPVSLQIFVPGISAEAATGDAFGSVAEELRATPLAVLDRFMTSWTRFVGDPVMSKWIVIILAISVFLNGYLLKGIALGTSRAEAAESAARILLAATGQIEAEEEKPGKVLRRHSTTEHPMKALRQAHNKRQPAEPTIEEDKRERKQSSGSEGDAAVKPLVLAMPRPRRPAESKFVDEVDRDSASSNSGDQPAPSRQTDQTLRSLRQKPSIEVTTPSAASEYSSVVGSETPATTVEDGSEDSANTPRKPRGLEECIEVFAGGSGATLLSDEEIILLVQKGKIAAYALEKLLKEHQRAVRIRRALICKCIPLPLLYILSQYISSSFLYQDLGIVSTAFYALRLR